MSDHRQPISDPEILELFADEPELLAVTDAIHATHRPVARPRTRFVAVLAAALIVAVAAAVLWPRDTGFIEAALAAVGDARVIHSIVQRPAPQAAVLDIASGRSRAVQVEVETWYDTGSGKSRTITRADGVIVSDSGAVSVSPLAGAEARALTANYRRALESERVRTLERVVLGGRETVWLQVPTSSGAQRVAVDAATHRPVAFEPRGGVRWRVLQLESVVPTRETLRPRERAPHPVAGKIVASTPISLAAARRLPWSIWLGRAVGGMQLTTLRQEELTRRFADGRKLRAAGMQLVYGSAGERVVVRVAPFPEPAYGFVEGRLTFEFAPIPAPGEAALRKPSSGGTWWAQLRDGRSFISVRAPTRELLVAAVRRIQPL